MKPWIDTAVIGPIEEAVKLVGIQPLGLQPGRLTVEEVARHAAVNVQGPLEGTTGRIRLILLPNQTNILKSLSAP
jgi:hypothetical protein